MMRASLLFRLLGLSLAVAVFAIGATAWLTTQETGQRFRGEFERTLESDNIIYQELTSYAQSHDSWDDVDELVSSLADKMGRRVALTTLGGEVLADSAVLAGGSGAGLPSTPTAEVSAWSNPMVSVEASDNAVAEAELIPEDLPEAEDMKGGTAVDLAGEKVVSLNASSAWLQWSLNWRMTDAELQERESLAADAEICLRDVLGVEAQVLVGPGGGMISLGDRDKASAVPYDLTVQATHPCVPEKLYRPSEAAMKFNAEEVSILQTCLQDNGVSYSVVSTEAGTQTVLPAESEGGGDELAKEELSAVWVKCAETSSLEAAEPFLPDPALLYTGSIERFDPFFGDGWWRTMLAGLAVLTVATGVTVWAGRRLTRPIRALTAAAERMGAGDHSARVKIDGRDEVTQLGKAFNSMAESVEANENQRRAMVSDVAHELRTPLANLRGYLEAAEDGVVPLDLSLVASLLEESALLQRLIDDLQELALADAGMLRIYPEARDAADLVQQVVAAHRASADEASVRILDDLPRPPDRAVVYVDSGRLRQAMGNLIANAIRFTPTGGEVTASVRIEDASVLIAVSDNGPGIAAEHLPKLFDRFYRVESSRSRETGGSGLGLAITKHLVTAHEGSIEVDSEEGVGSVFTIRLPLHAAVGVG